MPFVAGMEGHVSRTELDFLIAVQRDASSANEIHDLFRIRVPVRLVLAARVEYRPAKHALFRSPMVAIDQKLDRHIEPASTRIQTGYVFDRRHVRLVCFNA